MRMPRIFDNLTPGSQLLPALQESLRVSCRADFCVGYFNLRGWKNLHSYVESWPVALAEKDGGGGGGSESSCRILVGMQQLPHHQLESKLSLQENHPIDNKKAREIKRNLAVSFREQLEFGAPSNIDERALQRLVRQLKERRVTFKLFLRDPLHAKLYLCYRNDPINPIIGFVGSSNLTLAGLSGQGELNVDVLDSDAACKLSIWFQNRWSDDFCIDITDELVEIIEESWARTKPVPPYHIYLKMAYHLSREARRGIEYFKIPGTMEGRLFDFQIAAVKIAARHISTRGGVLIGDVVGLGKTLMASTIARIFEDRDDIRTLIICPKNLVKMWEDYREQYGLRAKVMSLGQVLADLENQRRYGLVIIDESHNLRNRDGKRYRTIREYSDAEKFFTQISCP